jgi:hypothetical protein
LDATPDEATAADALFRILAIQLGRCARYNHRLKSLMVMSAASDEREASPRIWNDPSAGAYANEGPRTRAADRFQSSGDIVPLETLAPSDPRTWRWIASGDNRSSVLGLLRERDRDGGVLCSRSPSVYRCLHQHGSPLITAAERAPFSGGAKSRPLERLVGQPAAH